MSGWTALLAAIPAIIIAWRSGDDADSAKKAARERAQDVSVEGYERDDRTWRYIRRVLDQQGDDIDVCYQQLDDITAALDEIYAHLSDEEAHKPGRRPARNTPRTTVVHELPAKPDWKRPPKPYKGQMELPTDLEALQRMAD